MKKALFALTSCLALVAFTAFSAPAFGDKVDPNCDLGHPHGSADGPYDNDPEIHQFSITFTKYREHAVAGYQAKGIACGTAIDNGLVGAGTLYDNARVRQSPGESTYSTDPADGIPLTSYVGNGVITAASFTGLTPGTTIALMIPNQEFTLRTDPISQCERENDLLEGGPEPGEIVACYKGTTIGEVPGHNWNWVVEQGRRDVTVLGVFYNDMPQGWPAGMTEITEFNLCAYAGATGAHSTAGTCGSPKLGKPLRANGDWAVCDRWLVAGGSDCKRGSDYGQISATAIRKDGVTTPPATIWAGWTPDCRSSSFDDDATSTGSSIAAVQEWKPCPPPASQ